MSNKTTAVIDGYHLTQGESFELLHLVRQYDDSVRTIEQMEEYLKNHTVQEDVDSLSGFEVYIKAKNIENVHFRITREMTEEMFQSIEQSIKEGKNKAFSHAKSKAHNESLVKHTEEKTSAEKKNG